MGGFVGAFSYHGAPCPARPYSFCRPSFSIASILPEAIRRVGVNPLVLRRARTGRHEGQVCGGGRNLREVFATGVVVPSGITRCVNSCFEFAGFYQIARNFRRMVQAADRCFRLTISSKRLMDAMGRALRRRVTSPMPTLLTLPHYFSTIWQGSGGG